MRNKLYQMIEPHYYSGRISAYNVLLVGIILMGAAPLVVKERAAWFHPAECLTAVFFSADYILRWITADLKAPEHGRAAFRRYPLTNMAVVDLAAAAAYLLLALCPALASRRWLMLLRIAGCLKLLRYLRSKTVVMRVLKKQKKQLLAVCFIAVEYIILAALIAFNGEPDTFPNFFDAVYWATISLTTVGYGDIYPVSELGHVITMISSFFGIAIIAMPAGIITAGILQELGMQDT